MIAGVILAGGLNRRMGGRMKALLPYGGRPMLLVQLAEMAKLCRRTLVVTNSPEAVEPVLAGFADTAVGCIPDLYVQAGPLGGIHAACVAAEAEHELLWIVGCDMPFISAEAARAMSELAAQAGCDAVVPVIGGRRHPLHGVYARRIGAAADTMLRQKQHRLMDLLDRIDWLAADDDFFLERGISPRFAANLNTPEEYESVFNGMKSHIE